MLRLREAGGGDIRLASCNFCRTVSGLAGRKSMRRSHCEMVLMPQEGLSFLSWMMRSVTAGGSFAAR